MDEVRIVYKNGINYVITRCPGEFDIEERRSWIQSQILNTNDIKDDIKDDIKEIVRMSMFRMNYRNSGCRYSHIDGLTYEKWDKEK